MPGKLGELLDGIMDLVSEEGTVTVLGRPIRYASEGHWYKWEVVYKVDVVDELSQLTAKADNNYSWHTSLRKALTALLQKIHDKGILDGISSEDLQAVATAVTECVEESSKCGYSQQLQDKLLEKSGRPQAADTTSTTLPPPPPLPPSITPPPTEAPPTAVTSSSSDAVPSQAAIPAPHTSFLESYVTSSNATYTAVGASIVIVLLSILYCYYGKSKKSTATVIIKPRPTPDPTTETGHILVESDLSALQKLLVEEAAHSFTLGIQLGLSVGVVKRLEKDAPADTLQFQGLVLGKWLQCKDPPPTVEKLVDVLSGPVICNKALALAVKEHFGLS